MTRKDFIKTSGMSTVAFATVSLSSFGLTKNQENKMETPAKTKPLAITMWDFSWLERRWAGAGYEDWDKVLDELIERGYNAVRIDAFPHLVASDPNKEWTLVPVWNQQIWGSPDVNKVVIQPALNTFISKCLKRKIKVALSSWFREDADDIRMKVTSPEVMADIWIKTIRTIEKEGLLDAILYVDLCNEWPGYLWAPYLKPQLEWGDWKAPASMSFIKKALALVRKEYPTLPLCFSFDNDYVEDYENHDLSFMDLFEHHLWMSKENGGEYNKQVGYAFERFSDEGYKNLSLHAERVYKERPDYWKALLTHKIERLANAAMKAKHPLITTECWGLVDYKDWPLLKWDWIKELCAVGVSASAKTGQWVAIATSNFCGPQFNGMWSDVKWHQQQTVLIKNASINEELRTGLLYNRLA